MDSETKRRLLKGLREPTPAITTAMAEERARQLRANGHGEHGYRDLWQAGIDAALREVA